MIMMLIILGMTAFILIKNTSQLVERTIANPSISTVKNLVSLIDTNQYEQLLDAMSETEGYWSLRDQLNDIREKSGLFYEYTLAVVEGNNVVMHVDVELTKVVNHFTVKYI